MKPLLFCETCNAPAVCKFIDDRTDAKEHTFCRKHFFEHYDEWNETDHFKEVDERI